MIYIFFAQGFEEIEAVATLDILRRAKLSVTSVGVGGKTINGAHGIPLLCDITDANFDPADLEMIILPGGMPGTLNLEQSPVVRVAIDHAVKNDHWICAICAAPSVYGHMGLLKGKNYTCFPGFEEGIDGNHQTDRVVQDGKLITAKGPGAAIAFGLAIVEALRGKEQRNALEASLQ